MKKAAKKTSRRPTRPGKSTQRLRVDSTSSRSRPSEEPGRMKNVTSVRHGDGEQEREAA